MVGTLSSPFLVIKPLMSESLRITVLKSKAASHRATGAKKEAQLLMQASEFLLAARCAMGIQLNTLAIPRLPPEAEGKGAKQGIVLIEVALMSWVHTEDGTRNLPERRRPTDQRESSAIRLPKL
jgi:hypothetical protein